MPKYPLFFPEFLSISISNKNLTLTYKKGAVKINQYLNLASYFSD